jgi:SAM-dependent methyltransferase
LTPNARDPLRRVARVFGDEGYTGLWRHVRRKLTGSDRRKADSQSAIQKHQQATKLFRTRVADLDFPGLDRFYWYHTIDLGDGIITPGMFDYRKDVVHFRFPEDMTGMNVLDVGSATGFFAFEFEKRGASVTSVELASIADWDTPSEEDRELTLRELMREHEAKDAEELTYLHLHGPFRFCQERKQSKVSRCYSRIYDLRSERLPNAQYDVVFLGDILCHLFSPLKALSVIAPLCRSKLIVAQGFTEIREDRPLMLYLGGDSRHGDNRTWWDFNRTCLSQMLKRLGFRSLETVGEFSTVYRRAGWISSRKVIHATK